LIYGVYKSVLKAVSVYEQGVFIVSFFLRCLALVSSIGTCYDTKTIFDTYKCPVGKYTPTVDSLSPVTTPCSSCFEPTLGVRSFVGHPTYAYYTGESIAISFDRCPWKCNNGMYPSLGFCYPGADCSISDQMEQQYSTVRNCVSTAACQIGDTPVLPSASILTAHSNKFTALLIHKLADSSVLGVIGKQCFTEQTYNTILNSAYQGRARDGGSFDGNFSSASFGTPLLAQQSGGSDLTAVFDTKYLVLKIINRTSQEIRTVAGVKALHLLMVLELMLHSQLQI